MASLQIALAATRRHEGGWQKDSNDSGNKGSALGTYCGITQKNYPNLSIWAFLAKQTYVLGKIFPELEQDVTNFYDKEYWTPMRGNEINDQTIATETFDMGVLKGLTTAIEITQQSAGLKMSGIMDDATINGLNNPTV